MKIIWLKYTPFLFLFILFACQKEQMGDCFKSTGKIVTEDREILPFNSIELDDRINLYISQSTNYKLQVEAGKNLLDGLSTQVENGTLSIENHNRCNWVRSYQKEMNVFLSCPSLQAITYYGSGEIRMLNQFQLQQFRLNMWEASGNVFLNLNCNDVELKSHTGPADIYCEGTGKKLVTYLNGVGRLESQAFQALEVLAINNNSGLLSVRADSLLDAYIRGEGDIILVGQPKIALEDLGEGDLIR